MEIEGARGSSSQNEWRGRGGGGGECLKTNKGGRGVKTPESWANVLFECPQMMHETVEYCYVKFWKSYQKPCTSTAKWRQTSHHRLCVGDVYFIQSKAEIFLHHLGLFLDTGIAMLKVSVKLKFQNFFQAFTAPLDLACVILPLQKVLPYFLRSESCLLRWM